MLQFTHAKSWECYVVLKLVQAVSSSTVGFIKSSDNL